MKDFIETGAGEIFKYFTSGKFVLTIIAIVVAVIMVIVISKLFRVYLKKQQEINNNNMSREGITLVHVMGSVLSGVVIIIAIIFILQINGLQVSSLITSVSIISAIVGLALQDTIKDIFQGIQILSDKFFRVGDVVKYDGYEGVVVSFTMRSTRIRDIRTFNDITIANRNLSKIEKQNNKKYLKIQISYDEPVDKMYAFFEDLCPQLAELEEVQSCTFRGLNKLDESALIYLIEYVCEPQYSPRIERRINRKIMQSLNAAGISVPYNQLDVHLDK